MPTAPAAAQAAAAEPGGHAIEARIAAEDPAHGFAGCIPGYVESSLEQSDPDHFSFAASLVIARIRVGYELEVEIAERDHERRESGERARAPATHEKRRYQ